MSASDAARSLVAAQLEALTAGGQPLSGGGHRATVNLAENYTPAGHATRTRRELRRQVIARYLARQNTVARGGVAALLTAGPPGAGKTTALGGLGLATPDWRLLDADLIKDYLVDDAVNSGRYDDLLTYELADGHPITPAELGSLVHVESVSILDDIRVECLRRGENVIIEGTLGWAPYAAQILDELLASGYHDVRILDVEVAAPVARERAVQRWWNGRRERFDARKGPGGRYVPVAVIERLFPDPLQPRSVCAVHARELFESDAAGDAATVTLTLCDSTSGRLVVSEEERRHKGHQSR